MANLSASCDRRNPARGRDGQPILARPGGLSETIKAKHVTSAPARGSRQVAVAPGRRRFSKEAGARKLALTYMLRSIKKGNVPGFGPARNASTWVRQTVVPMELRSLQTLPARQAATAVTDRSEVAGGRRQIFAHKPFTSYPVALYSKAIAPLGRRAISAACALDAFKFRFRLLSGGGNDRSKLAVCL